MNIHFVRIFSILIAAVLQCACGSPQAAPTPQAQPEAPGALAYPLAHAVTQVDDYHGEKIADPYRWLETDGPDTRAWIEAQNGLTRSFLSDAKAMPAIRKRLEQVWNYPKVSTPYEQGQRYFWRFNEGLKNQAVLCWSAKPDGQCSVLLDPNALASDGTIALATWAPSKDGQLLAYATAASGSDWNEVRVRKVDSGADLPDHLRWVKFSGLTWDRKGTGFWYGRYDAPKPGEALTGSNKFNKLYFHKLGQTQDQDELVWQDKDHGDWGFAAELSEDGRFLVVGISNGAASQNGVMVKDLADGEPVANGSWLSVVSGFGARFDFLGSDGATLYFRTDFLAAKGRIVQVRLARFATSSRLVKPTKGKKLPTATASLGADPKEVLLASEATAAALPGDWTQVVAEDDATLLAATQAGDGLILSYLRNAYSELRTWNSKTGAIVKVATPQFATVNAVSAHQGSQEVFISSADFLSPPQVSTLDLKTGALAKWFAAQHGLDPAKYKVEQIKAPSRDGTIVPVFLVHRQELVRDGTNPVFLYAYGGFNSSVTPNYSPAWQTWIEMGGVLAVAVLRGGGEFGEQWHKAGMRGNKQNVFDDFIGSAQWLVTNRVAQPGKIAIAGGSNGGLLVGACMTQRPDLFGAALPAVGVMDMLRFHKFTIGWAWVPEYGSADNADEFRWLRKFSPLHNLRSGVRYPPTMVTTGDHDDRVVPGHSFKFTAALQAANPWPGVSLIRIETKAGHGAGKPTGKMIEEWADRLGFLSKVLNVPAPAAWK
ncbi:MAG: S9 family peptidase [Myxococcales bacterium]|nr:S9 family peptidase [Myxococcales bacterium]